MEPGALLGFAQERLQIAALTFMIVVCALRIVWILKFPATREGRTLTFVRDSRTGPWRGGMQSLLQAAMPWTMSSMRQHPGHYFEFFILHLGIAASIVMSFLIPYQPAAMASPVVVGVLQVMFAAAFAAGTVRLCRRASDTYMKSISNPDDYFTLALLMSWLAFSTVAAMDVAKAGQWPRVTYFILTAFLFAYVPFSKILHYVYYPFARWYLGAKLAARGAYPVPRNPAGQA